MKERFISFQTPMVQAEREGRKTMTRRIIDPQPEPTSFAFRWKGREIGEKIFPLTCCPYGKPGDILRVREAAWMWCEKVRNGKTKKGNPKFRYVPVHGVKVAYRADRDKKPEQGDKLKKHAPNLVWRLKIPRFLPGWAIRTKLEIVSLRVERLQDISAADAIAEGIQRDDERISDVTIIGRFAELWRSINGPESWRENPWVWVIAFKKV